MDKELKENLVIGQERRRVEKLSWTAGYGNGVMEFATEYCGNIFRRHMKNGSVLELGPAEGLMTDILIPFFSDYTVVDGASKYIQNILQRHPNIQGYSALFEEYVPTKKFDNIVLGHVLEHVNNPVKLLKECSQWLNIGGRILSAVPNSHSIHRQAAVLMGLLEKEEQLNDTDFNNGHRRVYNMDSFKNDFLSAGLTIIASGGYWIKPESNEQIDAYWNKSMIKAFLQLGEQYPEIAAEIYIIATV